MTDSSKLYPWQHDVWQLFARAKQQSRVPHAILISGLAGLGKLQLAQAMVESLLCQSPLENAMACGHCHSCQLLAAGSHPDHHLVTPEEEGKQIKIDQIRLLKDKQMLMPKVSTSKTVLISHADNLNISAFNSLLKLLEEPQPNTVLILITQNSHRLPITIRSRCQLMNMAVPTEDEAINWLQLHLSEVSPDDWHRLLKLTQGAPLAALTAQQQGLVYLDQLESDFQHLLEGKFNPISLASTWQQHDLLSVFHYLHKLVQEKLQHHLIAQPAIQDIENHYLWAVADCILNTIKLISSPNNLNKTLLIEDFMVSIAELGKSKFQH